MLSDRTAAMELTWSHDYCLACENQTSGGAYCSQSCRLADLEQCSSWSTPQGSPSASTFPQEGQIASSNGFYLTPAIDWSTYKTAYTTTQKSLFASNNSRQADTKKALTPSSSHSSLNSTTSASAPRPTYREEVSSQLREYANSFDTTRNRRRTLS